MAKWKMQFANLETLGLRLGFSGHCTAILMVLGVPASSLRALTRYHRCNQLVARLSSGRQEDRRLLPSEITRWLSEALRWAP